MSRDILNHGVAIQNRTVAFGSVPEDPPTLPTHGYSIVATKTSGITIISPFVLCLCSLIEDDTAIADLHIYGYFQDSDFTNKWTKIRTVAIRGSIINYIPFPTLGASRFHAIIRAVSGSPTAIKMHFRAVSKDAIDLIRMLGEEFSPVSSSGGKIAINEITAVRIGPLTLDRPYQFFSDRVCWHRRGGDTVTATTSDVPIQAGPVYQHTPRTAADQYISFLSDSGSGSVWYGQAF